jgi:hypothetical protein
VLCPAVGRLHKSPPYPLTVNDKKIEPHIPVIDKSRREDGTFSRADFVFDKERNTYVCPNNKLLHTTGTVHDG